MEYLRRYPSGFASSKNKLMLQSMIIPITYGLEEALNTAKQFSPKDANGSEITPKVIIIGEYYLCQFYKTGVLQVMITKRVGDLKLNYITKH